MSINGMYSGSKYFSKKPSNKKSFATSFTQINKLDGSLDEFPTSKNRFLSNELNKSSQTLGQKRQTGKKDYPISKFYTQQDEEQDNKNVPFFTDTSIVDRGNKTKSSAVKKDKMESNFRSEPKGQRDGLVEELYAQASNQLQRVNQLISSFNQKISRQIKQEFKKFKEVIISTIDKVFSESSETFKKIIEKQQAKSLAQIQSTKQLLESLCQKFEKMKGEAKSSRKRVQQQIKSNNIQEQLDQIIEVIDLFEKGQAKININIDRKRINAYDEALQGLLQLQDENPKQRRNY